MKNKSLLVILWAVLPLTLSACYKDPGEVKYEFTSLESVNIHTDFQEEYLIAEDPQDYVYQHRDDLYQYSISAPKETVIEYKLTTDSGVEPKEVFVNLSENKDMSDALSYKGENNKVSIYNLKVNTTYYYQIEAKYVSSFKSEIKSFKVKNTVLRNIFVDGVENCRDLGGWDIGEGRVYKEGLIYRTAQFNYGGKYNDFVSKPTEAGLNTLRNELKIKTDIDLRKNKAVNNYDEVNGITSSPIGEDVNYVACPMVYSGKNVFALNENKESIQLFFETLSKKENYPVAFHCVRGTDRTGALAYMLGALVGMNETDLLRDYLFSNYSNIGSPVYKTTIAGLYVRGIAESEGDTYQEKAKNYLMINCEVKEETINQVINNLVEEVK